MKERAVSEWKKAHGAEKKKKVCGRITDDGRVAGWNEKGGRLGCRRQERERGVSSRRERLRRGRQKGMSQCIDGEKRARFS